MENNNQILPEEYEIDVSKSRSIILSEQDKHTLEELYYKRLDEERK